MAFRRLESVDVPPIPGTPEVKDGTVTDPNKFVKPSESDNFSHYAAQPLRTRKTKRSKIHDDYELRRRGDQLELDQNIENSQRNRELNSEDAQILTGADVDEAIGHRFFDVPGIRKHIINRPAKRMVKLPTQPSIKNNSTTNLSIGKSESTIKGERRKSGNPHELHEVFVELDELVMGKDHELVWKEKARWIKFEEDVEDNEVWGKPHIASLSFLSLWEVRKGMEKGLCLLDLEAKTLPKIAAEVVTHLALQDLISSDDRLPVMNALLLKHRSGQDIEMIFYKSE